MAGYCGAELNLINATKVACTIERPQRESDHETRGVGLLPLGFRVAHHLAGNGNGGRGPITHHPARLVLLTPTPAPPPSHPRLRPPHLSPPPLSLLRGSIGGGEEGSELEQLAAAPVVWVVRR